MRESKQQRKHEDKILTSSAETRRLLEEGKLEVYSSTAEMMKDLLD